eukprot:jgi/Botrbrau1/6923/Bobra.0215s0003.3
MEVSLRQGSHPEQCPLVENPVVSPWRVDAAQGKCRASRLQAILDAARGPRLAGIDGKVALFIGSHVIALCIAFFCRTDLSIALHGVLEGHPPAGAYAKLMVLIIAEAANLAMYCSLYHSNPGWITSTCDDNETAGPMTGPCQWCTFTGPLRKRHCHNTGQCVVKFDHFCPLLATAIGSQNAVRFLIFCAIQTFLVTWGVIVAIHALLPALPLWLPSARAQWRERPFENGLLAVTLVGLLMLLNAFLGLLCLHLYLASTNQTTYELLKGVPCRKAGGPGHWIVGILLGYLALREGTFVASGCYHLP